MQLYSRAASSCAFRVRIGLNIKQLHCELIPVTAVDQGKEPFRSLNPQGLVPLLVHNKGHGIGQSIAILEYLEELSGSSGAPLLPSDPPGRARVRAIAQYVVSEIQPLQNTRLDGYLHELVCSRSLQHEACHQLLPLLCHNNGARCACYAGRGRHAMESPLDTGGASQVMPWAHSPLRRCTAKSWCRWCVRSPQGGEDAEQ